MTSIKKLSGIDLNHTKQIFLEKSIEDYEHEIRQSTRKIHRNQRIRNEELLQISASCVKNEISDTTEKISTSIISKVLFVFLTSMIAYYGLYTLAINYLIDINSIMFYMAFIIIAFILMFMFVSGIHNKNYDRTQILIYFFIYTGVSFFGIIITISILYPITSYQIINSYFYIMIIQLLIFMISVPITKKIICKSNINEESVDVFF